MFTRKRLAFILAPLFPSIFFLFAFHLTGPRWSAFVLLFSLSFSYLPCWVLGAPLIRFLQKRESLSTVNISLCGALFGIVVFYVFGFVISAVLGSSKSIIPSLGELIFGALLGISVALPFSLISGFPILNSKR